MKYLLDSHIIFWLLTDSKMLSKKVFEIVDDKSNQIFFSQVSLMEFTIKISIGKLKYENGIIDIIKDLSGIDLIYVWLEDKDLGTYESLPLHHRDPFDRFLIAQAKRNSMTIITSDEAFRSYDVDLVFNK